MDETLYTELEDTAVDVIKISARQAKLINETKGQFSAISANLTAIQAQYAEWATEVNTLAAANPGNAAIQALKAKRDRLVADFNTIKSRADALVAAVSGI